MPSSATLTTFYSFTPNTKARASQVNNNFNMFRGHIISVDPNTATSTNNTYDLGSSEWRWRSLYVGRVNKMPVDNTSSADTGGFASTRDVTLAVALLNTSTATHIAGSTITIATTGSPIEIGFVGNQYGLNFATTTSGNAQLVLEILRNGSSLATFFWQAYPAGGREQYLPGVPFRYIDILPSAGSYIYSARFHVIGGPSITNFYSPRYMYAQERD